MNIHYRTSMHGLCGRPCWKPKVTSTLNVTGAIRAYPTNSHSLPSPIIPRRRYDGLGLRIWTSPITIIAAPSARVTCRARGRPRKNPVPPPPEPELQPEPEPQPQPEPEPESEPVVDDEQAADLVTVAEGATRRGRRAKQSDWDPDMPSTTPPDTNEENPERFGYHRELLEAAEQGKPNVCRSIMQLMEQDRLLPGPRAYHTLIYAYVKADDAAQALEAARDCIGKGMSLIPESYVLIIYAFTKAGEFNIAEDVMQSMEQRLGSAELGWHMYASELFRGGHVQRGLDAVTKGRQLGWGLEPDLQALYIEGLCKFDNLDAAEQELNTMKTLGIQIQNKHCAPVLEGHARKAELSRADLLLAQMDRGVGFDEPDLQSFHAYIRGVVICMGAGIVEDSRVLLEKLDELRLAMYKHKAHPDSATLALLVKAYSTPAAAKSGTNLTSALRYFNSLRETVQVQGCRFVDDDTFAQLLVRLSEQAMPSDISNVLTDMIEDDHYLPPNSLQPIVDDQTFITAWLNDRLDRLQARGPGPAIDLDQPYVIIEDVCIGVSNCCVEETGMIKKPVDMSTQELVVELGLRGQPKDVLDELPRTALTSMLRNLRKAQVPAYVAAEQADLKMQLDLAEMRETTTDLIEASDISSAAESERIDKRMKAAKKKTRKTKFKEVAIVEFVDGKEVRYTNLSDEELMKLGQEQDADAGEGEDDLDEFSAEADFQELFNTTSNQDARATMMLDDILMGRATTLEQMAELEPELNEELSGAGQEDSGSSGKKAVYEWSVNKSISNMNAGSRMALVILQQVEQLGGRALPGDYRMLLLACEAEHNAEGAWHVASRLWQTEQTWTSTQQSESYSTAVQACLNANNIIMAQRCADRAAERGVILTREAESAFLIGGGLRRPVTVEPEPMELPPMPCIAAAEAAAKGTRETGIFDNVTQDEDEDGVIDIDEEDEFVEVEAADTILDLEEEGEAQEDKEEDVQISAVVAAEEDGEEQELTEEEALDKVMLETLMQTGLLADESVWEEYEQAAEAPEDDEEDVLPQGTKMYDEQVQELEENEEVPSPIDPDTLQSMLEAGYSPEELEAMLNVNPERFPSTFPTRVWENGYIPVDKYEYINPDAYGFDLLGAPGHSPYSTPPRTTLDMMAMDEYTEMSEKMLDEFVDEVEEMEKSEQKEREERGEGVGEESTASSRSGADGMANMWQEYAEEDDGFSGRGSQAGASTSGAQEKKIDLVKEFDEWLGTNDTYRKVAKDKLREIDEMTDYELGYSDKVQGALKKVEKYLDMGLEDEAGEGDDDDEDSDEGEDGDIESILGLRLSKSDIKFIEDLMQDMPKLDAMLKEEFDIDPSELDPTAYQKDEGEQDSTADGTSTSTSTKSSRESDPPLGDFTTDATEFEGMPIPQWLAFEPEELQDDPNDPLTPLKQQLRETFEKQTRKDLDQLYVQQDVTDEERQKRAAQGLMQMAVAYEMEEANEKMGSAAEQLQEYDQIPAGEEDVLDENLKLDWVDEQIRIEESKEVEVVEEDEIIPAQPDVETLQILEQTDHSRMMTPVWLAALGGDNLMEMGADMQHIMHDKLQDGFEPEFLSPELIEEIERETEAMHLPVEAKWNHEVADFVEEKARAHGVPDIEEANWDDLETLTDKLEEDFGPEEYGKVLDGVFSMASAVETAEMVEEQLMKDPEEWERRKKMLDEERERQDAILDDVGVEQLEVLELLSKLPGLGTSRPKLERLVADMKSGKDIDMMAAMVLEQLTEEFSRGLGEDVPEEDTLGSFMEKLGQVEEGLQDEEESSAAMR